MFVYYGLRLAFIIMSIQIYILDASGRLTPYKNIIQKSALQTVKKVRNKIALKNVDIVIKESERPELLKNIDGVGGYCPSGHFAQLSIDINHPMFSKFPERIIERSLLHELHHAMRRQAGVSIFGGSFLECMFSEGLADYFVYELTGEIPVWANFLAEKTKKRLMSRAKRKFKQKITYKDYDNWFTVGSSKLKIPKWAGYALGFELVGNYFKDNPSQSAASLVSVPIKKLKNISK